MTNWNETTNLPEAVHVIRDTSWVGGDGIGICAECVFAQIVPRIGWDASWDAPTVFAQHGYEPCDDDWCSVCDRDTRSL